MARSISAAVLLALFAVTSAHAEPVVYTWTGMGTAVEGSSKCATYRMTVDITIDGKSVKGVIKQQGRQQRAFEATLGDGGAFKTKAEVGGGNTLEVSGTVSGVEGRVLLDGYCKFSGKLTPK